MNDKQKETKVPIYIATIVAVILVVATGYFVMVPQTPKAANNNVSTEAPNVPATTTATVASPVSDQNTSQVNTAPIAKTPIPAAPTIKCELCHTNPQNLSPHVNGGKLCINCHGSQVHNIHIGEGTVNLDCKTCHGFPPKIPTVQKGTGPDHYSVCEQCHAPPPDNTKPSHGNLIVIHLSRGKYCTNCHGTDIGVIHAQALSNLANRSETITTGGLNQSTPVNTENSTSNTTGNTSG